MAGLPWIQLEVGMPDHPKARALALELGIHRAQAVGHLCVLWTSVGRLAPHGLVSAPHASEVLEQLAGWDGEPGKFTVSAVACKLVDEVEGGLLIHDWEEHAGAFVEKFQRDAERKRKKRAEQAKAKASAGRPPDVRWTSTGRPSDVQREREREREREKEEDLAGSAVALPAGSPVVASLPCVGEGPATFEVTEAHVGEWSKAYPGIDVLCEVRKAKAWLEANHTRRKTHRGSPRFLVSWLNRAQDRPSPQQGHTPPPHANGERRCVDVTNANPEDFYGRRPRA